MRRVIAARLAALAVVATVAGCTSAMPAGAPGPRTPASSPRSTVGAPTTAPVTPPVTPAARRHHHRSRAFHSPQPLSEPPTLSSATATPVTPATTSSAAPPPSSDAPPPTVVLNPGHNGGNASHPAEINRMVPAGYGRTKACDTTGTNTDAGYPEHAFTWDVSLRVARILRAHHLRVVFTRHSDDGVGPCVNRRAAIGNHPWVAAVVSIHADGAPASGHGFHVNQDSRRPQGATRRVARQSRQLGTAIHDALVRSSGLVPSTYIGSDGYYYRDDLAGLDLARRPATFLELGNMRNAHDAALQTSARGRERIAKAVAAGILAYLAER